VTAAKILRDLDIDALVAAYKVRFVGPKLFVGTDIMALNAETTIGKKLGIPDDEIWIDRSYRKYGGILALHEAIEHYLRAVEGMLYDPSHKIALKVEKLVYGGTRLYEEFVERYGAP
jgi:hypothetical protein